MKLPILLLFLLGLAQASHAQQYTRELRCSKDTISIPAATYRDHKNIRRTVHAHRIVQCERMSNMGLRLDGGISNCYYSDKTSPWLGSRTRGVTGGVAICYRHINAGARISQSNISTQKQMVFDGDTLTTGDSVSIFHTLYTISYSLDFKHNISIEPYLGLSSTIFAVTNPDDSIKSFSIPKGRGLSTGITINKYVRISEYGYAAAFVSGGYALTNYRKVNGQLGRGFAEWSLGLAFKCFGRMAVTREVK